MTKNIKTSMLVMLTHRDVTSKSKNLAAMRDS